VYNLYIKKIKRGLHKTHIPDLTVAAAAGYKKKVKLKQKIKNSCQNMIDPLVTFNLLSFLSL